MHLDVRELRHFYQNTALGRMAARTLQEQIRAFWQIQSGQTVVGFGYPLPLLQPYVGVARRVIAFMPGPQGVIAWPKASQNVSALIEETAWPLPTGFVDRLVVLHGLETSQHPCAVLEEAGRVLGPGGRALFIVPNRSGLWARHDRTPFGYGSPYSAGQLDGLLRRHGFVTERKSAALFAPPALSGFWLRSADFWERLGRKAPWLIAGVMLVEASKSTPAPQNGTRQHASKRALHALRGLARPAPQPAPVPRDQRPL